MRTTSPFIVACLISVGASAAHAQTVLPEWVEREAQAWRGVRTPQLEQRQSLFRSSRANTLPEGDAMLICRVHVEGRWDLFGDPDLAVRMRARSAVHNVWGTENSRTEVFSFPSVNARRGLTFRITDRDVTFDEPIATVTLRWTGSLPLVGDRRTRGGRAEVECRAVDPALIESRTEQAVSAARVAVTAFEGAQPNLRREDLGRPSVVQSRRRLVSAGAWSGWAHAPVASERRRLERAERSFEGALRAAISETWRDATRPGQSLVVDGATLSVQGSVSGGPAARQVPASTTRDEGWRVQHVITLTGHASRADVLDRRGHVHAPRRVLSNADGTTQLVFDERLDTRRAVLRLGASRDAFLRLR